MHLWEFCSFCPIPIAPSELEFMLFLSASVEERERDHAFWSRTRSRDHSSEIQIDTPDAHHMKSLLVHSAHFSAAVRKVEKESRLELFTILVKISVTVHLNFLTWLPLISSYILHSDQLWPLLKPQSQSDHLKPACGGPGWSIQVFCIEGLIRFTRTWFSRACPMNSVILTKAQFQLKSDL